MSKRYKVSSKSGRKMFSRTADRSDRRNSMPMSVMRGGYRL